MKHLLLASLLLAAFPALAAGRGGTKLAAINTTPEVTVSHRAPAVPAMIADAAHRNGVPAPLLHGIVMVESRYHCDARNGAARGIGQVLPQTARGVGVVGNLLDCSVGLEAAARYLRLTLAHAGGNWHGAATLYNRGLSAAPRPTAYSRQVMAFALAMEDEGGRIRSASK